MTGELAIRNESDNRQLAVDTLMAVVLTLLVWVQVTLPRRVFMARFPPRDVVTVFEQPQVPTLVAFLLVVATFMPLALRRRYPLAVLVAVSVASSVYSLFPLPAALTQVGVLIAFYTAGSLVERRAFVPWAVVASLVVVATSVPRFDSLMFFPDLIRTIALLFGAAAIGVAVRNQRAYLAEMEQRAIDAERVRDEETKRRIDEERLSIARELHDITAHSLSIVAVQSGAALHVLDSDPEAARTALTAIRDTSKSALAELRAMLGVLRGATDAGGEAPLAPAPGLSHLGDIVRPLSDAGMTVDLDVDSGPDALPAMVDSGAYRIVQEALTNALRHAGASKVRVSARRVDDTLELEVSDNGPGGAQPAGEGHGIAGMRERALALGGTFGAGPAPGGGWWVFARIPLPGRAS